MMFLAVDAFTLVWAFGLGQGYRVGDSGAERPTSAESFRASLLQARWFARAHRPRKNIEGWRLIPRLPSSAGEWE